MNQIEKTEAGKNEVSFQNPDFLKWMEEWLDFIDKKETTKKTYRLGVRAFLRWCAQNKVSRPERADILAFKADLLKRYKTTTASLYLQAVSLFFGWLAFAGLYPDITLYVDGISPGKAHKDGFLEADEAWKLLSSIKRSSEADYRDYALLSLMLTTGLRRNEIAQADLEDLRLMNHEMVLYILGKGRQGKQDYVKIPVQTANAIRDYLNMRRSPQGPLFCGCSNRCKPNSRLHPDSITRIAAKRLKQAGLKQEWLTAHSLRHTAATLNLEKGGSLQETMQMLRHTNLNTTLIYAHALQRKNNRSEQRVADAIFRFEQEDSRQNSDH